MVITMAKLRMAHASTHGARKPPGPKKYFFWDISSSYAKILGEKLVGQKQKTEEILQGLQVAQAAVTERWP